MRFIPTYKLKLLNKISALKFLIKLPMKAENPHIIRSHAGFLRVHPISYMKTRKKPCFSPA